MQAAIAKYGEHKRYVLALPTLTSSQGNEYLIVDESSTEKGIERARRAANIEDWHYHDIHGELLRDYIAEHDDYIIVDTQVAR